MFTNRNKAYIILGVDGSRVMDPPDVKLFTHDFNIAWRTFFQEFTKDFQKDLRRGIGQYFYPPTAETVNTWRQIEEKMLDEFDRTGKFIVKAGCGDFEADEPFILMIQKIEEKE